jgi:hypothetical protein
LRHASDVAREGCATAVVAPPPTPPTTGVAVTPGAANIELVRIDPPQIPPTDVNWPTVSAGTVKYLSYPGTPAEITGEYTWSSPAATIGPQGFSMQLTASCNSVRDNTFATGIGMLPGNFDAYVDGKPTSRIEVPVNCGRGEGKSASVTVQVVPRASYAEGDMAEIAVGPFWAGSVRYSYKARKISP